MKNNNIQWDEVIKMKDNTKFIHYLLDIPIHILDYLIIHKLYLNENYSKVLIRVSTFQPVQSTKFHKSS